MYTSAINTLRSLVALRKESVDRNDALPEIDALKLVALRKESVDRNSWAARARVAQYCVALRKESVDRNGPGNAPKVDRRRQSLSARRAWIEIAVHRLLVLPAIVALRKESVDRNANILDAYDYLGRSLSARRAWIEICVQRSKSCN